ncbi:hypothetical protein KCP71_11760 [Salmonella enterica subsp. enterica]|nr:hypothetical protein KCP71_11760 [Salmonella enterica subsp. enterica]
MPTAERPLGLSSLARGTPAPEISFMTGFGLSSLAREHFIFQKMPAMIRFILAGAGNTV